MLESLLTHYGYPILIIGTFLEGETIMVLGGVVAHLGYLSMEWVIVCGVGGTVVGDQLFFYLGRRHGNAVLSRRPNWQTAANRVIDKLERHQDLLILGFRFLYGLRTMTPFIIGMSTVSYLRFTVLNVIGAIIWAVCIGFAGYYFGRIVEIIIGDIKHYEVEFIAAIIGIALLIWAVYFYRRRRSEHSNP